MEFWQPNSPLGGLARLKTGRSRRESSWDATGGDRDFQYGADRVPDIDAAEAGNAQVAAALRRRFLQR